ncbi:hypothetical protein RRG08_025686 [Elysia crispata]|uniref:Uncharacterized protein n=1 Tax=Elysia crispata TaxID=231223 RepID=A0AAE1AX43_9GAST|nr:hypothetical protein RRG08_025686 [Elysia crispata]
MACTLLGDVLYPLTCLLRDHSFVSQLEPIFSHAPSQAFKFGSYLWRCSVFCVDGCFIPGVPSSLGEGSSDSGHHRSRLLTTVRAPASYPPLNSCDSSTYHTQSSVPGLRLSERSLPPRHWPIFVCHLLL